MESIAEWLSHDLWWHSRLQNLHFWWPPSSGETGRSLQEPDQESKEGDQAQLPSSVPGIGTHGSHCVWSISKHSFCSRHPSRTSAPTVHVCPLQFSPICSRTWCCARCSIALRHYLSHWLRSSGHSRFKLLVTWSPYCVSILPMSLKNHVHACTHVPSCR